MKLMIFLVLAAYYAGQGSLTGIEDLVSPASRIMGGGSTARRMHEMHGSGMMVPAIVPDRILVVDREFRVLVDSAFSADAEKDAINANEVLERGEPVTLDGEPLAWVLVGSMIDRAFNPTQQRFLGALRRAVLFSAIAVAMVALAIGSVFLDGVTRPLRELTDAAQAITTGDLAVPLPSTANDEVGDLTVAFRTMRDSLEDARSQRDRMFRDIAHELRTPVTLSRGEEDAMLDGVYTIDADSVCSLQEEIAILDRLIGDVRLIASMDRDRFTLHRQSIEVGVLFERAERIGSRRHSRSGIGTHRT